MCRNFFRETCNLARLQRRRERPAEAAEEAPQLESRLVAIVAPPSVGDLRAEQWARDLVKARHMRAAREGARKREPAWTSRRPHAHQTRIAREWC